MVSTGGGGFSGSSAASGQSGDASGGNNTLTFNVGARKQSWEPFILPAALVIALLIWKLK